MEDLTRDAISIAIVMKNKSKMFALMDLFLMKKKRKSTKRLI